MKSWKSEVLSYEELFSIELTVLNKLLNNTDDDWLLVSI